jgi:hypothetical protein
MLLDALITALTGLDLLSSLAAPWRFLFSANFRERKRQEWREAPHTAAMQQIAGVFGAVLTIALVAFVVAVLVSIKNP